MSEQHAIKVLLCDDHDGIRGLVRDFLADEDDITVVSETADVEGLFEALKELEPDVVLLDCTLRGRSGLDAIEEARALSPGCQILMFSADDDPAYCRKAFGLGAHGYLLKESAEQLPSAIRVVEAGGKYLDARLHERVDIAIRHGA